MECDRIGLVSLAGLLLNAAPVLFLVISVNELWVQLDAIGIGFGFDPLLIVVGGVCYFVSFFVFGWCEDARVREARERGGN